MTDIQAWLTETRTLANRATEGPWAAWTDQDGAEHMQGRLMVGNAAAVIPEGESWVEGVDINPVAHVNTGEDREFIADARTRLPQALNALRAVLDIHAPIDALNTSYRGGRVQQVCTGCGQDDGNWNHHPCPTVRAIQDAIGGPQ